MITPTLGAMLVGLLLLAIELGFWFPGIKALQKNTVACLGALLPFLFCWCIGALTAMVVGGLVGLIGDGALWGLNAFGDGLLVFGVGAERGTAPGSTAAPLTQGGLFMTVIVIGVFFARCKRGARWSKWRGWFSGVGLALTGSVARYAAVPLASGVNLAGAWLTGAMT